MVCLGVDIEPRGKHRMSAGHQLESHVSEIDDPREPIFCLLVDKSDSPPRNGDNSDADIGG